MNNAKMWLVVKPTVGVPLFLTAVAVGSFAVHVAVLSNTTWVADFLSGKPLGAGAMASLVVPCRAYCCQGLIRTRSPSCNSRPGNRADRCGTG